MLEIEVGWSDSTFGHLEILNNRLPLQMPKSLA